jgi:large subunit ribosomal protein L24
MSLNIKKGDTVLVIAGKDNGKTGTVLEVSPKTNKIVVDGVNVVSRHQKPRSQQDKGGIIKKNAAIDASNAMVVCPDCGKATKVKAGKANDTKVRLCKKCGASLDKEHAKTVKKEAKKVAKTEEKPTSKKSSAKADSESK